MGTAVALDAGVSTDNVDIVSYEWDFGNETTSIGIIITNTYTP